MSFNQYICLQECFNQITTSLTMVIIKAPLYYGVDDLQRLKSIKIYFKLHYIPNRNISAFLCTGICIAYCYGVWCHSLIPGGPLRSHAQSSNVRINQQLTFTREIKSCFLGFQTWCSWQIPIFHGLPVLGDIICTTHWSWMTLIFTTDNSVFMLTYNQLKRAKFKIGYLHNFKTKLP